MLLNRVLAVFMLVFSSAAFAGSVNINMSNTAAQFEAGFSPSGNGELRTGFMYNDQGSVLLDAGLMMKGGGGEQDTGLVIGGGVKALAGRIQQAGVINSVSCIAIGGRGAFTPAALPSVALVGEFLSSLKITTYGDANRFGQFSLNLELGPPHAKFIVGYREIAFSITGAGTAMIDKGSYMGIMISF